MKLSRKNFLMGSMALAATSVVACGDDEDETGSGGSGGTGSGNTSSSSSSSNSSSSTSSSTSSGMGGMGGGGGSTCSATEITNNHDHAFTMTDVSMLQADTPIDIQGTSGHPHTITLSAADITSLEMGNSVTVTSTADGGGPHTHDVTISCA